jgi:exopolysaccharide production protein ExoQ
VEVLLLLLTLYLFKGSDNAYSATAVSSFVVGFLAYAGLAWMKRKQILIGGSILTVTLAILMVIGITTPLLGGGAVGQYAGIVGRDQTLTSRTDIWAQLLPYVKRQPILGTGFGAFWTSQRAADVEVNEAHNGYLEVLLQMGAVGLFISCMFLFACAWDARATLAEDYDWGSLCICFVLMSVVYNVGEASIDSFTNHLTAMQLFLLVTCRGVSVHPGGAPSLSKQTVVRPASVYLARS